MPSFQQRPLLQSIAGANPAAGAEFSVTVPAGAFWVFHALRVNFVADANPATRQVRIIFDDGTNEVLTIAQSSAITAGVTGWISAGAFADRGAQVLTGSGATLYHIPVPPALPLGPGYRIRSSTDAIQVGDDFGAPRLLVEQWAVEG